MRTGRSSTLRRNIARALRISFGMKRNVFLVTCPNTLIIRLNNANHVPRTSFIILTTRTARDVLETSQSLTARPACLVLPRNTSTSALRLAKTAVEARNTTRLKKHACAPKQLLFILVHHVLNAISLSISICRRSNA